MKFQIRFHNAETVRGTGCIKLAGQITGLVLYEWRERDKHVVGKKEQRNSGWLDNSTLWVGMLSLNLLR